MEPVALNVQLPGIIFPKAASWFSEKYTKVYYNWILFFNEGS